MPGAELFVGNLDRDIQRREIEDVFEKYGKILRCDVKNKGMGAAFCFLEFEEARDAEDAMKAENGKHLQGAAMVVEFAKGRGNGGGRDGDRRDGGFRGGYRDDRRGGGFRGGFRDGGRGGGGFRGGRDGGRGGGGGRDFECYECGEKGHFARDCRKGGGGGGRRDGGRDRNGGGRDGGRDGGRSRRDRSRSADSRDRD